MRRHFIRLFGRIEEAVAFARNPSELKAQQRRVTRLIENRSEHMQRLREENEHLTSKRRDIARRISELETSP